MAVVAISQKLFVMGSVLEKLLAITKSFAKLILKRLQGWFFNVFYQVGQLAFGGSDETSFLIVLNFNPNTTYLPKILIRKAARIFKDGSLAWHFLARKDFVLVWLWIRNKAFFLQNIYPLLNLNHISINSFQEIWWINVSSMEYIIS